MTWSAAAGEGADRGRAVGIGFVLALGASLLGLHGLGLYLQIEKAFQANVAVLLGESAVYALVVWLVVTGRAAIPLWLLLGVAALLRLIVLFPDPHHSTDIYRYIWDGRVQAAGINPYLFVPNDPALAELRDPSIWARINRAGYATTIYPPAAEALFYLVTRVGETVVTMKAALVLFEAAALWGIIHLLDLDGTPRDHAVILAWSPLAAWEIAGSGHVDAAMMALVVLAVLLRRRGNDALAGGALGLAVLVKFFPLALLPALWRRGDWRLPAAMAAVIVVGYVPYLGAGKAVLGFLPGYAGEEGIRDGSGFWLLRVARDLTGLAIPTTAYLAVAAAALAGLALAVMRWPEPERLGRGILVLAAASMLALTPVYPWYVLWLLPFMCLSGARPVLWPLLVLISSAFLLYWGDARAVPWLTNVVYGGTLAAACLAFALHRWPPTRGRMSA